ncbi:MAG: PAS domain S-box-containing protein, partial [Janthinobacterium sp.]
NNIAQKIDPQEGSVSVLRYDGTLLFDTDPDARIGSNQPEIDPDLQRSKVQPGKFERTFGDHRPTLSAFRSSERYPFVVVTHIDRAHALQQWQSAANTQLVIVIPALLVISLLAIGYYLRQSQFAAQQREVERLQSINATVFETSTQAIIITDLNAIIISVNPAFTVITGYSAQEVIGHNPRLLASGLHDSEFYRDMWSALRKDGIWRGDLINQHKDGRHYDARLTLAIARDSDGWPLHFIADIADITERKQAKLEMKAAREREIAIAFNIQQALLMADLPQELNGAWITSYVEPSQGLHGDFVAVSQHTTTRFNVLVGDVMGKGIHAAMIGAGVKNTYYQVLAELMSEAESTPDAAAIVNALHRRITPKLIEMDCFVTLALYVFDANAGTVSVVNAGHTEGLLARAGCHGIERISGDNMPIGVLLSEVYQQHVLNIANDDQLVIYSDGISETCNADGAEFGANGIAAWLGQSSDANLPSAAALQLLRLRLNNFASNKRIVDDKTVLIVRLRPVRRGPRKLASARRNADYLTLPLRLDALPALRSYIEQASAHWPPADAEALLLAVFETASNAIRHTQSPLSDSCLACRITSTPGKLDVAMYYLGPPVEIDADAMPDFSGASDGGFGLFIIRSLVESIDYSVPLEDMVCVRLVKYTLDPVAT